MTQIHPTAIIESGAYIGSNVQIGPYCVIGKSVRIEDDVVLKAHVCIDGHTTIGQATEIFPGAVIGSKTQDLKYRGETTYVEIGKKCQIRECVTINSSCGEGTVVKVGDNCLIMAYCHIAHNCILEDQVIMVNNATLAGHIHVGKGAVIGGLSAVHQFSNIGCFSFIGGMSRITHDVLPYSLVAGSPAKVGGLNLIGLKRRGVPLHVRNALSKAFRLIYRESLSLQEALNQIELTVIDLPEVRQMVSFCLATKRGLIGMQGINVDPEAASCDAEAEEEKDPTLV